ncbi:MAG: MFS transporter [Methyloligellaceae bacterium]
MASPNTDFEDDLFAHVVPREKWLSIALLSICIVFGMSLWFSLSAVVPTLKTLYRLDDNHVALLSSSVSVGFVVGTLTSALLGLADLLPPRRYFALCALGGATVNAVILLLDPSSTSVIVMRFLTGALMGGIYPVGMRMMATWANGDTGVLIGILTSSICIGSGMPHLIDAFGGLNWVFTVAASSGLAFTAGIVVSFVQLGPRHIQAQRFKPAFAAYAWTVRPIRLANLGYWGHKWENFAMWAWIGPFLYLSFSLNPPAGWSDPALLARYVAFSVFFIGAPGCLIGGFLADRFGRTLITSGALVISGVCAVLAGLLFGGNPWLLTAVCLLWGFALIADSAQFSSCIIELSDPNIVGTMLTMQTCVGFFITLVSIQLIPLIVDGLGWDWAMASLAIGPVMGIWAMARLRRHPEAERLAGGRR